MDRVKSLASGILGNIRKVRVQLEGTNYLHMREVQVFDQNGVNVALNKVTTQSSDWAGCPSCGRFAVNGNLDDLSHTGLNAGKYTHSQL